MSAAGGPKSQDDRVQRHTPRVTGAPGSRKTTVTGCQADFGAHTLEGNTARLRSWLNRHPRVSNQMRLAIETKIQLYRAAS